MVGSGWIAALPQPSGCSGLSHDPRTKKNKRESSSHRCLLWINRLWEGGDAQRTAKGRPEDGCRAGSKEEANGDALLQLCS